ncbi:hypothetical protein [Streptomyces sp. NPDC047841]|uniref:hypothetical protein n=1 Tax=Streptomyces sp. NPDC047841 TaxID=3154708 RepID=UPI003453E597
MLDTHLACGTGRAAATVSAKPSRAWTTAATTGCSGPFAPDLATGNEPYQLDYTYDGIGNLQKVTNTTATGAQVNDYVYPGYSADQSAYTAGAAHPHAVASVKTPTGTDSYEYDDAGQLKRRTVGGRTSDFVWNELSQVTATSGAATTGYVYDGVGNLLVRRSSAENVLYLAGQEVHKAPGATAKATRYYSDGSSTVAMRTAVDKTSSKLSWIMSDAQASTQLTVDTATGTTTRRKYLPTHGQRRAVARPEHVGLRRPAMGLPGQPDHRHEEVGPRRSAVPRSADPSVHGAGRGVRPLDPV